MHECMRLLSVGVSVAEEKDHGVRLAARVVAILGSQIAATNSPVAALLPLRFYDGFERSKELQEQDVR